MPPDSAEPVPSWFREALAVAAEVGEVDVAGVPVRYRAWGTPGNGGIVLVHGGGAHSRWWDHIAPLLAAPAGRRIIALDLTGHGDSGRRAEYSLSGWAEEAVVVGRAGGAGPAPVLVGHSMGGMVALTAARMFGAELGGAITVDTPVRDLTPEEAAARDGRAFGPLRIYRSREKAISHFRLVPAQAKELGYVVAHIAEHSVRPVEGGWAWKFDPQAFRRPPLAAAELAELDCRVALFRAEHGLVPAAMSDMIVDRLGRAVPSVEIPTAAHHLMVDEPIALVTGLRALLADWEYSTAMRPAAVSVPS
ncbi:alpha/beta fold hydrolase [Pseudonocardia kunmingensis]|uniref:Alpha-beta hydrolase superfamily lysophospholipase n=1 Tax=Pseudonocardia kunmingensis TaxID=630975 RepID=A0A543DPT1_9PSEU|nr:alpha/beta hydrolase [Pseudonocardia kunmingensis]TQM11315.1 alpha-beta hydrolase superfamily lysophospholipase [Pseudonocardia kunmingensis]